MTKQEILECLCYYDNRNPDNTNDGDEFDRLPRTNCYCDNCFHGLDKLTVELLKYVK